MGGKFSFAALKKPSARPDPDEAQAQETEETQRVEPSSDDSYPHGVRLVLTAVALCMSIFLVALDGTIVSTAIPTIADEFDSLHDVGWVS